MMVMSERIKEMVVNMDSEADIAKVDATAPVIEKMVNAIILAALSMKASDIHIEPFEDPTGKSSRILLRYRVDGELMLAESPPKALQLAITSRIKILAGLNIAERRVPQDGERIPEKRVGASRDR